MSLNFPNMYRIRQLFDASRVDEIEAHLDRELARTVDSRIRPGSRVAITAGSRGVRDIDRILRHIVQFLKSRGAKPFLFPAMGSHGGGKADGQLEVLRSLNITEQSMGAPVLASMETVEIARSSHGFPVHVDKCAAEADGIVVVNRVKPHTDFSGPVESGLMKMMAIGMGKWNGCTHIHRQTVSFGYGPVIAEYGEIVLNRLPILCGVGIVENARDEIAEIRAVTPENLRAEEERLLILAKSLMARLPFDQIDVLVIDEMGKEISGTGMDTNVIGRIMFIGEKEPEKPRISRIVVLDLTEASHGNATGIGLADFTTRRLVDKINLRATAINTMTGNSPEKARIPIYFNTDSEAVEAALATIGIIPPGDARIVHIKNTLELAEMEISESMLPEVGRNGSIDILGAVGPIQFGVDGAIRPFANT